MKKKIIAIILTIFIVIGFCFIVPLLRKLFPHPFSWLFLGFYFSACGLLGYNADNIYEYFLKKLV